MSDRYVDTCVEQNCVSVFQNRRWFCCLNETCGQFFYSCVHVVVEQKHKDITSLLNSAVVVTTTLTTTVLVAHNNATLWPAFCCGINIVFTCSSTCLHFFVYSFCCFCYLCDCKLLESDILTQQNIINLRCHLKFIKKLV